MFRRLGQDFQLRKVKKILKQINALKGKMSSLSDQELVAKTVEFRQRLSDMMFKSWELLSCTMEMLLR